MAKKQKKKKLTTQGAIISPLQHRFKFTMFDEEKPVRYPGELGMTIEFGLFEED